MATNFVQRGDTLTIPAPAAVLSGQGVSVGNLFGVAAADAEAGADFDMLTAGVFELPKVAANSFALGDLVYWDAETNLATSTATDNAKIGAAVEVAGSGAASVVVKLIPSI